eukprot:11419853-Alexandrium_andersonii.AAC.1
MSASLVGSEMCIRDSLFCLCATMACNRILASSVSLARGSGGARLAYLSIALAMSGFVRGASITHAWFASARSARSCSDAPLSTKQANLTLQPAR